MARTWKGYFGISLAIFGALLLAAWFIAGPIFRSAPVTAADEAEADQGGSDPEVKQSAVTQSAPVFGNPPAETENAGIPSLKKTRLRQRIRRKTESGEYVVLFEAGEELEVVTLQGSRIYLRTPEGETIGIPVEATDWVTQEDENPDP